MKTNFVALGSFGRNMMNYYQKNCGESGEIICLSNDEKEIQTACLPKDSLVILLYSAAECVYLKEIIRKLQEDNNILVSIFTMPFTIEKSENKAIAGVNKKLSLNTADMNIIFDNQQMMNGIGMLPFPNLLEQQYANVTKIINTIQEVSVDSGLCRDALVSATKENVKRQVLGNFEII